jgi:uncharacterized DUF497 family protein
MTIHTWDEAKRRSDLRKHGLDFADASAVFDWRPVTYEDTRFRYNERRFSTIGISHGDTVVVTYTEHDDEIHIISFRKADKREASRFYLQ